MELLIRELRLRSEIHAGNPRLYHPLFKYAIAHDALQTALKLHTPISYDYSSPADDETQLKISWGTATILFEVIMRLYHIDGEAAHGAAQGIDLDVVLYRRGLGPHA